MSLVTMHIFCRRLLQILNLYLEGKDCCIIAHHSEVLYYMEKSTEGIFCKAPDFVCEVFSSYEEINGLSIKKQCYATLLVKEYWTLCVAERILIINTLDLDINNQFPLYYDIAHYAYDDDVEIHSLLFPRLPIKLKFIFGGYTDEEYDEYINSILIARKECRLSA